MKNRSSLIAKRNPDVRKAVLDMLEEAISAVDPYTCVKDALDLDGNILSVKGLKIDLGKVNRIFVVGGGKASIGMLRAVVEILGDRITAGIVNSLESCKIGPVTVIRASHPHPSEEGLEGARRILELCRSAGENDLVLCLISGGGSAMLPLPAEGITLEEKKETARLLMMSGATIDELNVVRKHLSMIKGGRLARAAYPAMVISLIMSDVVGDPLESIASGPTAPDSSTYADALDILRRYNLLDRVPRNVLNHLLEGKDETPKPDDPVFDRVHNIIVANNRIALVAAAGKAAELGYTAHILTSSLEGEAREVGIVLSSIGSEIVKYADPFRPPVILLAGGETTVTVRGSGKGGRNTELVLGALTRLEAGITLLSVGTDGVDGSSGAAGAIVDCEDRKDDIVNFLENNDSATYLAREGCLIDTGPTGTNVCDIVILAITEPRNP